MTSSAVYPYMRWAPVFQLVISPSTVFPTMASSDESTIAESSVSPVEPRQRPMSCT